MKKNMRTYGWLLAMVGACLTSVPAAGTTLVALSLEDLTLDSDHIITGQVLDSTAILENGRIYTLHRVQVDEDLDGILEQGEVVEMVTAGGHSEWFSQKVFGAPSLEVGGRYLLFLREFGVSGAVRALGMSQGALPVVADPRTRQLTVNPSSVGARLVRRFGGETAPLEEAEPWLTEARSLDDIVGEIRAIMERAR